MRCCASSSMLSLRSTVLRWLVTLAFCATTVGVPCDGWPGGGKVSCAMRPGESCQCPPARRRAGMCCCRQRLSTAVVAVHSPVKSCCGTKSPDGPIAKPLAVAASRCCSSQPVAPPTPRGPHNVASCQCGTGEAFGLLWSGEPRVLTTTVLLPPLELGREHHPLGDVLPSAGATEPAVPPPRDRRISA